MKRTWLMLLLLCTAVLSGCTESEDEAEDDNSEEDEIYVTGTGDSIHLAQNKDACHGCTDAETAQGALQVISAPCETACQ